MKRSKMFEGISGFDYASLAKNHKPMEGDYYLLTQFTWIPISVASCIISKSVQGIRFLVFENRVRSMRFRRGPLLVCLEDIEKIQNGVEERRKRRRTITA